MGSRQVRPRCKTLAVDVSSGVEAVDAQGKPQKGIKDPAQDSTSLWPPYAQPTNKLRIRSAAEYGRRHTA